MAPLTSLAISGRVERRDTPRAVALTIALASAVVLALLSGMARQGVGAVHPAPMPVEAPVPALAAGFPEQANPWRGCMAITSVSAATTAPRSDRASEITTSLLADACFGA